MKSKFTLIVLLLMAASRLSAQEYTQTIRGTIIDKESKAPLPGATVVLLGSDPMIGSVSNEAGRFKLLNVPVGRRDIRITFIGYNEMVIPNIIVNSGKEVVLYIEMTEMVMNAKEVVVTADKEKAKANNEMATVSARSFSIEETNRYAGALGDPARMAANFAGVSAPSDARNDIIIRGNSPVGLLWRLEGIDIPSPNHFSAQGTTGGPVSILNNNVLRNSDFFTGAWPAEYGDAISGVFDLKMRNGNNEKYEFTGQVGFNGFEGMAEGPISKKKGSSFLASYRYSALGFFQSLGINLGPAGVPRYQDLSFKVNLPLNEKSSIDVFGIGGISYIELLDSKKKEGNLSYGQTKRDIYFGSQMGTFGVAYTKMIGKSGFFKTTVSTSAEGHDVKVDSISQENNQPYHFYKDGSFTYKESIHSLINEKLNARNSLRGGIIFSRMDYQIYQSKLFYDPMMQPYWRDFTNDKGNSYLGQAYIHWKHDFTEKLSLLSGIQYEHLFLNNTYSIEPRAGLKWNFAKKQSLSLGYGLHGQIQPLSIYYFKTEPYRGAGVYYQTNKDLGFTQSQHFVLAYDLLFSQDFRLKLETYYQYLYNVPVSRNPSSYSVLNNGADFGLQLEDSLVNKGTGRNYGVEITLEKFFSHNYYFLLTGSFFDSKYKGSDGVLRNTAFNSQYTINGLAGKDFHLGRNNIITFSGKITYAGGRRYTPADIAASNLWREIRTQQAHAYELQFDPYFKIDARLGYKWNSKKVTQEWAIDVQNLTNHRNVLNQIWDPINKKVDLEYQLGIFPMFLYRIQF